MGRLNKTVVTEFILVGLSNHPQAQVAFFTILLVIYLLTLLGNSLITVVIWTDSQLHTPMYFFLSNLSFLDICYTSTSVPQALANCFIKRPTTSFINCFSQMCISLYLGVTECFLLAVMAYDCFVAICNPLHYPLIMNGRVCIQLAVGVWASSFFLTVIPALTMPAEFCGSNVINHFTCEVQAVLKLACSDTYLNGIMMFASGVLTLLIPFAFILVTYIRIGMAVLCIRSAQGRSKAVSTCSSHLTVVSIFYGTAMVMYVRPQTKSISEQDKLFSVFYGVVTPMLNPLIYSLRNKDVKGALKRVAGKKMLT
ncbi:olfactory receptor 13H1 [Alligator mississippiensis]|uniref:Olfactory receptor 13H1-like n=1 Tax=Alligator mississippiensis TaxID=8496 RepID=A0A151NTW7_ALLMI|nr:olfactory receptor 13H1 [Alligator mississippiensis]KYO39885.1 olfactory receptor 13H1-like [Alligator mississippiensis]